jgi:hypothetical protein
MDFYLGVQVWIVFRFFLSAVDYTMLHKESLLFLARHTSASAWTKLPQPIDKVHHIGN